MADLPGFYYDKEKNRYFPIKGPIPGSSRSSSVAFAQETTPKSIRVCDEAEMFTSEMHDPCAHSRCLQKRTRQKLLTEGTGVGPAKHPPKVKSEIFFTTLEC